MSDVCAPVGVVYPTRAAAGQIVSTLTVEENGREVELALFDDGVVKVWVPLAALVVEK
jgi:hypothetical protein